MPSTRQDDLAKISAATIWLGHGTLTELGNQASAGQKPMSILVSYARLAAPAYYVGPNRIAFLSAGA